MSLADHATSFRLGREIISDTLRRDPLSTYVHASWASEWVCDHLADGWWYLHAANSAGKSHFLAALFVALAQGRESLGLETSGLMHDGRPWRARATPLPVIPPRVAVGIGTPTYKLGAAGSIIDKLREMIGGWPHHEERVAGSVSVFHVQHRLDPAPEWQKWSTIHVFPYEGPVPEGVRLDAWGADEPPPELWLSAILNRGKQGRPLYGGIGATPVVPRLWRPIRMQFPDAHCTWINGRARIQSSVYDNRFLTAEDIARQERANPPQHPLSKAKLLGEHVNAVGSCPFDLIALGKMLAECVDPERETMRVPLEDEEGRPVKHIEVTVEWFQKPKPGLKGFCTFDPASGIDDARHNPLEFIVSEVGTGDLLARWSGKIPPFSAGVLCATIARQYDAWVDIEMKDHWGANVVRGVEAARYAHRLSHENRMLRPDVWSKEVGWDANAENVALGIGAIQTWLAAYSAGIPYAKCPSRDVLNSIMDTELDENDKIINPVAADGGHGEGRVCWGRNLHRCVKRSNVAVPRVDKAPLEGDAALIAKMRQAHRRTPGGVGLLRAEPPIG